MEWKRNETIRLPSTYGKIVGQSGLCSIDLAISLLERKNWIQNSLTPLKNDVPHIACVGRVG